MLYLGSNRFESTHSQRMCRLARRHCAYKCCTLVCASLCISERGRHEAHTLATPTDLFCRAAGERPRTRNYAVQHLRGERQARRRPPTRPANYSDGAIDGQPRQTTTNVVRPQTSAKKANNGTPHHWSGTAHNGGNPYHKRLRPRTPPVCALPTSNTKVTPRVGGGGHMFAFMVPCPPPLPMIGMQK